jgi:NAD(P)H-dependent flavin oxidoreductase YrpB (nitropropane dioxygenase family)
MQADTAVSNLPRGAPQGMIYQMITKLVSEQEQARTMIKDEVEVLMWLGAEVTKMTYMCKNTDAKKLCIKGNC